MFPLIRKLLARITPFFLRKHIPLAIAKHLYFKGVFQARLFGKSVVTLSSNGHQIENEIYWKGFENSHEGLSTQIWAELVSRVKPKNVWDIGANSGTYGILVKSIFPECKVSFFEPIPKALEMIHDNLSLNNFEGNVFALALGDFDGTGSIYFPEGSDFETSVTVNQDKTPSYVKSTEMQIEVARAESIIDLFKLEPPNLIKLDVETFEVEVLEGFGRHFPADSIFLIEVLTEFNAIKLRRFFTEERYTFYNIDDREGTMRMTRTLEKSDFYNYLIFPNSLSLNLEKFLIEKT
jgi:FkbM family methyltransferase